MKTYVYGFHAIEEALKGAQIKGRLLIARHNTRAGQLVALAKKNGLAVTLADESELDNYCPRKKHKGALLLPESRPTPLVRDFKSALEAIAKQNSLVLLLDGITDPHNYGAILRSADQFYADMVITTEKKAARETEVVASTSAGANVYVPKLTVTNLIHVIDFLKTRDYWVYGADIQGTPAGETNLKGRTALVLGSEGKGLRRLVKDKCDQLVRIPSRGHVDSLNVSVAAGILMYEIRRQQKFE